MLNIHTSSERSGSQVQQTFRSMQHALSGRAPQDGNMYPESVSICFGDGDLPRASADFAGGIKYFKVPYDKTSI